MIPHDNPRNRAEGRDGVAREVYAIFACYLPDFAHHRVAELSPMPGVLVVLTTLPIGAAIEELSAITAASEPDE